MRPDSGLARKPPAAGSSNHRAGSRRRWLPSERSGLRAPLIAVLVAAAAAAVAGRGLTATGGSGGAAPPPVTGGSAAAMGVGRATSRAVAQCPAAALYPSQPGGGSDGGLDLGEEGVADSTGGLCKCTPGWVGPGCSRCRADVPMACTSLIPADPRATCVSSLTFTNRTLYKIYSCDVEPSMSRFLVSLEAYCSTVPISPLLPAYNALSRQLTVTGFNMSQRSAGAGAGGDAAEASAAAGGAGGSSGGGIVVSQPYCVVSLRGGPYFNNGVMECLGLGCRFVEGSRSYKCDGGLRCACPPKDPAAVQAGVPASTASCSERMQGIISSAGKSFGMDCGGSGGAAASGGGAGSAGGGDGSSCKLSIDGVPFTLPMTCRPNECRTATAAAAVATALSRELPPPPRVAYWVPLVAAVPLVVVVALAAAMLVGLLAHRRHFAAVWDRYDMYESRSGEGDGKAALAAAAAGEVAGGDTTAAAPDKLAVPYKPRAAAGGAASTYAAATAASAAIAVWPQQDHHASGDGVGGGDDCVKLFRRSVGVGVGVGGGGGEEPAGGLFTNHKGAGAERSALRFRDITVTVPYSKHGSYHPHHPQDGPARRTPTEPQQPQAAEAGGGGGGGGWSGWRGWGKWAWGRTHSPEQLGVDGTPATHGSEGLLSAPVAVLLTGPSTSPAPPPLPPLPLSVSPSTSTSTLLTTASREGATCGSGGGRPGGKQWRSILSGVSGFALEGEVLGVVGPSGCGKSTLLSVLSSSFVELPPRARVAGSVSLGGQHRPAGLRRLTGLVPQSDVLPPALTVSECIGYSAALRLAPSTPPEVVKARVAAVISELGLERVACSLVGVGSGAAGGGGAAAGAAARGISGGERRRLSIGMELVISPLLLVLDEPTSGLDSWAASNLMQTCQAVASHGRVVVMSLHQPSPDMVARLDRLLLLAPGGRAAFFGRPVAAPGHCAATGWPCPPGRAICEHLLQLANQHDSAAALVEGAAAAADGAIAAVAAAAAAVAAADGSQQAKAAAMVKGAPTAACSNGGGGGSGSSGGGSDSFLMAHRGPLAACCEDVVPATYPAAAALREKPPPPQVGGAAKAAAATTATVATGTTAATTEGSVISISCMQDPQSRGPLPPAPHRSFARLDGLPPYAAGAVPAATAITASAMRRETPAPWGPGVGAAGCRPGLGDRLSGRVGTANVTHRSLTAVSQRGEGGEDAASGTGPSTPSSTTAHTCSPRNWPGVAVPRHIGTGAAGGAATTFGAPGGGGQGSSGGEMDTRGDASATADGGGCGFLGVVVYGKTRSGNVDVDADSCAVGGGGGGGASEVLTPAGAPLARLASGDHGGGGGAGVERWWRACCLLFWRSGVDMARTPGLLLLHCALAVVAGCTVGVIFLRQSQDLTGMQNSMGAIFFSLCLFGFTALTSVDGLMRERALVAREVSGHYYGAAAYLLPRLVLDALLLRALPAGLYTAVLYPLVGLTGGAGRVAAFGLVLSAFASSVGALALCVAAVAPNAAQVTLLMNLLLLLWVMVGGFLVNPQSMPAPLAWLRYTSPLSYAFEALFANQVKGTHFVFDVAGYARVDDVGGETFMSALGLSPQYALRDVGILGGWYGGFALGALALTWLGSARHRGVGAGRWVGGGGSGPGGAGGGARGGVGGSVMTGGPPRC